jgi:hypothetical protein
MLTLHREFSGVVLINPRQSAFISQSSCQAFGCAQVFKNPLAFPERRQRDTEVEVEIDGLLPRLAIVGQMRQGSQRLLEVRYRFLIRRAGIRLGAGLPEIG